VIVDVRKSLTVPGKFRWGGNSAGRHLVLIAVVEGVVYLEPN